MVADSARPSVCMFSCTPARKHASMVHATDTVRANVFDNGAPVRNCRFGEEVRFAHVRPRKRGDAWLFAWALH